MYIGRFLSRPSFGKHRHHPFRSCFVSRFGQVMVDQRAVVVLIVTGALYSVASRYCLIFFIFDVFSRRHFSTKRICSASSLSSRDLTTSAGKSEPQTRVVLRRAQTVSVMSSTISSSRSVSSGFCAASSGYWMLLRIKARYSSIRSAGLGSVRFGSGGSAADPRKGIESVFD